MYYLYYSITILFTPLYGVLALWRLLKGKEECRFVYERFGISATTKRPDTPPIWVHCASVGETLSILPFLDALHKKRPELRFVLTTYTKTAAQIVRNKNIAYIQHAYIPYDHPLFVSLFLAHYRPRAVFWVESELWPICLDMLKKHKIPAALLNMRMSLKSFQNWQKKAPSFAYRLFSCFSYIQAQTAEYGEYVEKLSRRAPDLVGNLKHAAPPLSYSKSDFDAFTKLWGDRPLILFASTHEGEEKQAFAIYDTLKNSHKDLLFIIVPRHPERGKDIELLAHNMALTSVRRSLTPADTATKTAQIYIADTLGELGLFYALSSIAIIGNSFVTTPGGGHNMLEAAHLNCCILYGPSYYNFQEMHEQLIAHECALCVADKDELSQTLSSLLNDEARVLEYQQRALAFAQSETGFIERLISDILKLPAFDVDKG